MTINFRKALTPIFAVAVLVAATPAWAGQHSRQRGTTAAPQRRAVRRHSRRDRRSRAACFSRA